MVIVPLPLALFGAMLGLLTRNPFGFTALTGMIALRGIVARNGIILVHGMRALLAAGNQVSDLRRCRGKFTVRQTLSPARKRWPKRAADCALPSNVG